MEPYEFDTCNFIELIKKRPCLWNTDNKEYHDKQTKKNTWEKVAKEVYPDFTKKTDKEQNFLVTQLIKKWKNLRDAYMKSVNKRANKHGAKSKAYMYAAQLQFLNIRAPSPTTESGINEEVETFPKEAADDDQVLENDHEPAPTYSPEPEPITPTVPVINRQIIRAKRTMSNFTRVPSRKRKILMDDNLFHFMNRPEPIEPTPPPETNDDKCFFDSLLPLVKTLPIDTKLEFRFGVLGMLRDLRGNLKNGGTTARGTPDNPPTRLHPTKHQKATNLPSNPPKQTSSETQWETSSNSSHTPPVENPVE